MKRLFIISNDYEMDLNKEWMHLIPEFAVILHRVWKCEGDADGRKKVMQRRVFGYIWLVVDFSSPLFTWIQEARHKEALKMMDLKEGDLDNTNIQIAIKKYDELQQESVPALKALRGMYASLEKMNTYLETIDLSERDRQGKAVNTPASVTRAVKEINAAYDAVATMERRVMESLKAEGGNTIRGTATLGAKEGKRKKEWKEGTGPTQTEISKSIETAIEQEQSLAIIEPETDYRKMGAYLKDLTGEDQEE